MSRSDYKQRRGSASILVCAATLAMVTATAAITMQGLATQRFNQKRSDSRQTLHSAIQATQNLPVDLLEAGIRLAIDESIKHDVTVLLQPVGTSDRSLIATEEIDGKKIQSIQKIYLEVLP